MKNGGSSIIITDKHNLDLLNYAIENGIINFDDILKRKDMNERDKILKKHPYEIWESKDGIWYTYVPDNTKRRGIAQRKRKTKKDLEDAIVEYYRNNKKDISTDKMTRKRAFNKYSFKNMFDDLISYKQEIVGVSDNTISKYQSDYKRFFADTNIEYKDIRYMNEEEVEKYIVSRIHTLKLTKRNTKDMIAYMRSTFERGKKEVEDNPFQYIKLEIFNKHCKKSKTKTAKERTVSDGQMEQLQNRFDYYHNKKPRYIPIYAVELATMTGFRAGELAALRWDRIKGNCIVVDLSEKYNRVTKEYYIDTTKNGKIREYPLTEEINELLQQIYSVEKKYGYLSEYVFSNENGRIHGRVISDCARNACIYMGMEAKSIHAHRRTVSSKMKCKGIPTAIVASLMGHTEDVNERNYTYDVAGQEMKTQIISELTKEIYKRNVS